MPENCWKSQIGPKIHQNDSQIDPQNNKTIHILGHFQPVALDLVKLMDISTPKRSYRIPQRRNELKISAGEF